MEDELKKGGGTRKQDMVIVDGNILTSRGPATALPFALKIAEIMAGKPIVEAVSKKMGANILRW